MTSPSQIFKGYRALGFVSNQVPLVIRFHKRHKENYVVTCVGKSFHTYNCSKLGIVSVSDPHPEDISCIAVNGHKIFTGCGKTVRVFQRGKQVERTFEGHNANIHTLLPFGTHLISIDADSTIRVWDLKASDAYDELYLELTFNNSEFEITTAVHPSTYLNKIVFGSRQGSMQLWNIKTNTLIYTFTGWNVHVTVLEQAPAVDVLAIGLADGQIILHNIKFDESIVKFKQDWGLVTAISFRTDGQPIMVSGSTAGHIALWDLEERRLKSQIRQAHSASVTGLQCLPSEPLIITSSSDNSLKIWVCDMTDGGGRLLNQRAGHSAPPSRVRHYGHNGHNILSAGQDSTLQSFSTIHDSNNKSLGRASSNKSYSRRTGLNNDKYMLPPIIDFSAEPSRESDWDNIVAVHRGQTLATTWSYQRSTMGHHKFLHERFTSGPELKSATATCTAITSCGNFAMIGYSSGHIDVYNLQSGIYRGSFGSKKAHKHGVRALITDALNQVMISTGACDKYLKFWRFKTKELLCKEPLESCANQFVLHRDSGLLAVSHDDFTVSIIEVDTRNIVRQFTGHRSAVTDMTFSPDARWLISASMDSTVRTWHLPTSQLIDCFMVESAVTSLSFSPTADFLVSTHVDDLGLYLWSNSTLYNYVYLPPLPDNYAPGTIDMPTTSLPVDTVSELQENTGTDTQPSDTEFKTAAQISDELVTLSLLPESRWKNLLNIDIIKKRNKPKEPPKAPKAAPFFLPTLPGLEMKFDLRQDNIEHDTAAMKKNLMNLTDFGKQLLSANSSQSHLAVFSHLSQLGPSAIDLEIRSLSPEGGGSIELMLAFMDCISTVLDTNTFYEFCQATLALFIKIHGDVIHDDQSLKDKLNSLAIKQSSTWSRLEDLFEQSLCLVTYTRSATL